MQSKVGLIPSCLISDWVFFIFFTINGNVILLVTMEENAKTKEKTLVKLQMSNKGMVELWFQEYKKNSFSAIT